MINYYQYQGTISVLCKNGYELMLGDVRDFNKPPIIVRVFCRDLAKYLEDRSGTDEEERYIKQTWIYDRNLYLMAVIIPSTKETMPAKVIACANPTMIDDEIRIFGPQELIDTPEPDPMELDQLRAWWSFKNEHNLRTVN